MEEMQSLTVDDATAFLNRGGKWQWKQMVVIYLAYIVGAQQAFIIVLIGFQPNYICKDSIESNSTQWIFDDVCNPDNLTEAQGSGFSGCRAGFRYSVAREESIVSEWDLVCNNAYLSEVSQLLYTVGSALGTVLFAPCFDRIGRRVPFIGARLLSLGSVVAMTFVTDIVWFTVLRCIVGAMSAAMDLGRAVYITELSPLNRRPLTSSLAGLMWAGGVCLEALIGHLMRGMSWRYVNAAIAVWSVSVIVDFLVLKESLIWLYANGRSTQASAILKAAIDTNQSGSRALLQKSDKPVSLEMKQSEQTTGSKDKEDTGTLIISSTTTSAGDSSNGSSKETVSFLGVVKNKTMRQRVTIMCVVWFVNSLVYYGLYLMSSAMVGDRILNFFLIAAVEIPACAAVYPLVKRLGRQKALISCHGLCALSLLLAGLFNFLLVGEMKASAMTAVTVFGKFGISATFIMLYFYTTEILPTNFRSFGLGIASCAARIGSFLSPFSTVLLRLLPWGPGIIFGGLCLLVTGLLFLLPETIHRELPQTLEDIEICEDARKVAVD